MGRMVGRLQRAGSIWCAWSLRIPQAVRALLPGDCTEASASGALARFRHELIAMDQQRGSQGADGSGPDFTHRSTPKDLHVNVSRSLNRDARTVNSR